MRVESVFSNGAVKIGWEASSIIECMKFTIVT